MIFKPQVHTNFFLQLNGDQSIQKHSYTFLYFFIFSLITQICLVRIKDINIFNTRPLRPASQMVQHIIINGVRHNLVILQSHIPTHTKISIISKFGIIMPINALACCLKRKLAKQRYFVRNILNFIIA